MEKKVLVTVKSKQKINNEAEEIELVTPGKFYSRNDTYYVVYEETEISGMKGTTTTVKIEKDKVNIIRFGTTNTNLKFKKGVEDMSLYKTPYGVMEIIIKPLEVKVDIDEDGGIIDLKYELDAGGVHKTKNELYIKIK